jgi:hypothetical protein
MKGHPGMMTDYELGKTFFPGTRKEVLVESISLLMTRAGEKRIKVTFSMPLGDQKLVGMPTWLGDSYDVIAREDSMLAADKWSHDIKEMVLTIYPTEDGQKPSLVVKSPLMSAFTLRRDPQTEGSDELSDVNLHFFAYIDASIGNWDWLYKNFRASAFMKFETTQAELALEPKPDNQMSLVGDDHEADRREATSPAHDQEFAPA